MDNKNMIFQQIGILFVLRKEENSMFCTVFDTAGVIWLYVKWNKLAYAAAYCVISLVEYTHRIKSTY